MKYILTVLTAAFALTACNTTESGSCPHSKAKAGDACCAKKESCCSKAKTKDCCSKKKH